MMVSTPLKTFFDLLERKREHRRSAVRAQGSLSAFFQFAEQNFQLI